MGLCPIPRFIFLLAQENGTKRTALDCFFTGCFRTAQYIQETRSAQTVLNALHSQSITSLKHYNGLERINKLQDS